jgi:hypothetical protein
LYNAPGSLTSLQEGANLITTAFYTPRLQPCRISVKNTGSAPTSCADATTGNVMDLTYGFNYGTANNGNVQTIANNITAGRSQTFTYDELNRVTSALTQATSGTYCWRIRGQTGRFLLSCPRMARFPRIVAVNIPHNVAQRGDARQFILSGDAERSFAKKWKRPVCPRFSCPRFSRRRGTFTPTFPTIPSTPLIPPATFGTRWPAASLLRFTCRFSKETALPPAEKLTKAASADLRTPTQAQLTETTPTRAQTLRQYWRLSGIRGTISK